MIDWDKYQTAEQDINAAIASVEMVLLGIPEGDSRRPAWQEVENCLHDAKNMLTKIKL